MDVRLCFRLLLVYVVLTSGLSDEENASPSTDKTGIQHAGGRKNANVGICQMREWTYDLSQSELSNQILNNHRLLVPADDHIKDMFDNVKKMLQFVNETEPLARDNCANREQRWEDCVKKECSKLGWTVSSVHSSNNAVVTALLDAQPFWPRVCNNWARDPKKWWGWPVLPCEEFPKTLTHFVAHCAQKGTYTHLSYMAANGFNTHADLFTSLLNAVKVIPDDAFPADKTEAAAAIIIDARKKLTVADASALAQLFPYLKYLQKLHIRNSNMPAPATRKIIDQLGDLKHLEDLDLFSNIMDDEGVEKLSQKFVHLKNMKRMTLEGNQITPTGGDAIARNIAELQELEELVLGGYNRVANSTLDMAKAFLQMPKLHHVMLYALQITSTELSEVERQTWETIHLLKAMVYGVNGWWIWREKFFYDATETGNTNLDVKWETVRMEMRQDLGKPGVFIESSNRNPKLSILFWVYCSDC
ncbi:NLRC5 [Branchiostoma lanceolatum]|uniref:NLRC5 protein n=1 Tax=Branchiostoma lanceolatum TaxID=7740 RepID=A0A8K0EWH2_BRALA|nr:NLRC5 [Branchiostoma lanceolatum]